MALGLDKTAIDALYISEQESTFVHDEQLPALPVPALENTLNKYLDTVRPHVTEEEFGETERLVREFEAGQGRKLHELLIKHAANKKNWLEDWWYECAYLTVRSPLIPFQNMSGVLPGIEFWQPQPGTRVERAAFLMYLNLKFRQIVRNEKLRPMVNKGVPWSMDQFKRIYNSCRVPGEPKDTLITPFKTVSEGPSAPNNVIVMYRGYIFSFDGLLDDEQILCPQELAYQLYYIEKWCKAQPRDGPGLGALTVADRTVWAKNRDHLLSLSAENRRLLDLIERSIMVFAFEDSEPLTQTDVFMEVLGGDCRNRWADKSHSTIFFNNGISGGSADHTPMDGFATAVVTHYVINSVTECQGIYQGESHFRDQRKPERLEFRIDDRIMAEIERSKIQFRKNTEDINAGVYYFDEFGKAILRDHRFHPEAFVQVAIQLAYYRMHGRPASTYVTATTRKYYHGRTETCRACFPENVDFAKAVIDESASPRQLYQLLSKAIDKFQVMMSDAMKNEGCDRHFLGLYMIAQENGEELPSIFADPAFIKAGGGGNYVLSTSCGGYWSMAGGVPPMVENGYGCFYGIEDNKMTFTVTSYRRCPETDTAAFYNNMKLSLNNMQTILASGAKL